MFCSENQVRYHCIYVDVSYFCGFSFHVYRSDRVKALHFHPAADVVVSESKKTLVEKYELQNLITPRDTV